MVSNDHEDERVALESLPHGFVVETRKGIGLLLQDFVRALKALELDEVLTARHHQELRLDVGERDIDHLVDVRREIVAADFKWMQGQQLGSPWVSALVVSAREGRWGSR